MTYESVPSRRSVLSEVDDDIILLTICLYYVFNDCTKTSSTRVTGTIQLQRGLVYLTGVGSLTPLYAQTFQAQVINHLIKATSIDDRVFTTMTSVPLRKSMHPMRTFGFYFTVD